MIVGQRFFRHLALLGIHALALGAKEPGLWAWAIHAIRQSTLYDTNLAHPARFKCNLPQPYPRPTEVWIDLPSKKSIDRHQPQGHALNKCRQMHLRH